MLRLKSLLAAVLLALLAACSTDGAKTVGLAPALPDAVQAAFDAPAALPALPPGQDFNPTRIAAALTVTQSGDDASSKSSNVTFSGGKAQFNPLVGKLAWAIYDFEAAPGEQPSELSFALSSRFPSNPAYIGVSDYVSGRWNFFAPQLSDNGTLPLSFAPDQLTSPAGHIYVAIIAYNTQGFHLDSIALKFPDRYSITGQVVDENGLPLPGALITSTLNDQGAISDASGNFTLAGIPNGTWHLMATQDTRVFFENPLQVTVAGADLSGVHFVGYKNQSHFVALQGDEPNNTLDDATPKSLATPIVDTISANDDNRDVFKVSIADPGVYYLKVEMPTTVFFPELQVYGVPPVDSISSAFGIQDTIYLPLVVGSAADYLLDVSCQGGGGQYRISLGIGPLEQMGGSVSDNTITPLEYYSYVRLTFDDGADTTNLLTSGPAQLWRLYLQPLFYTVTPSDSEYSFSPTEQNINLSAGTDLNVNFAATPLGFNDNYEPNNTTVLAPTLSLPVNEALGSLSVGGGIVDYADFYKVHVDAGKFLHARVDAVTTGITELESQLTVTIYDSLSSPLSSTWRAPGSADARSQTALSAGDYYVLVGYDGDRKLGYGLQIEQYDGTTITVSTKLDGLPMPEVFINNYLLPEGWRNYDNVFTDENGEATLKLGLLPGEKVYLEAFRYGLDLDRQTRIISADAPSQSVTFNATLAGSFDVLEPNSTNNPLPVTLPLDLNATLGGPQDVDYEDGYTFTTADATPIKVTYDTAPDPFPIQLYVEDLDSNTLYEGNGKGLSSGEFIFIPNPAGNKIGLNVGDGFGHYNLKIEPVEAYYITGTVKDGMGADVDYARVSILENGLIVGEPGDGPGSFTLGPVEPGTYTLRCNATNFSVAPGNSVVVNVVNADVQQNFVLTYSHSDSFEPNNSPGSAGSIADATPVSGTIDTVNPVDGNDDEDWYSFTAAGPGLCHVHVDFDQGWFSDTGVGIADSLGQIIVSSYSFGQDGLDVSANLPSADDYRVVLYDGDCKYTLEVDYP